MATKRSQRAFITGIAGQDGHYLAELLLAKGYEVVGMIRVGDSIEKLGLPPAVQLVYGDLMLAGSVSAALKQANPDEVYNLAGMSHVGDSFTHPSLSGKLNGLAVVELLETIRILDKGAGRIRFYQASSSEIFGKGLNSPQDEQTQLAPTSPYGAAKSYAHVMTGIYRESFGLFACSGILYNHESPLRDESFVTRKVTRNLVRIKLGQSHKLKLGYLDTQRDWGFAGDYVEGMWRMLQRETAGDYVLATNETHTVRELVEAAGKVLNLEIVWEGQGEKEVGVDAKTGSTIVEIDPSFYRPAEAGMLRGNYAKAKKELGWQPTVHFPELVEMLIKADLAELSA